METYIKILQMLFVLLSIILGLGLAVLSAAMCTWVSDEIKAVRALRRAELRQIQQEYEEMFIVTEEYSGRHRFDPNKPHTTLFGQMRAEQEDRFAPDHWNEAWT